MSTSRSMHATAAALLVVAFCAAPARAADAPHFGQPISPAAPAAWDISVGPDGVGLPPGSGTPAQGAMVYAQKCAACHGDKGAGGCQCPAGRRADLRRRSGGQDGRQLLALCDHDVRFHPPRDALDRAEVADRREVYALSAYILRLNGIIGDNDVMNAETLPKVKMPNRDGFIPLYPAKH